MTQRYQKEIEEILDQVNTRAPSEKDTGIGDTPGKRPVSPRRSIGRGEQLLSRLPFRVSPARMVLLGIVLLVAAMVLRSAVPAVTGPLTWTGIGLFIAAYVAFFIRPRRPAERRWRGRVIADDAPTPSGNLRERFWRWMNRG
jgi:hypothetical protein